MPTTHYPQIQQFLQYLRFEKRCSPNTITSYQNDLGQFFAFLVSQYSAPEIQEITAQLVRSWLAELKGDKLAAKSINRKISSLKSFFKFMIKQGVLQQTPMAVIVSPKMAKRLPAFVADKDIKTLFGEEKGPSMFANTWEGNMERLILMLFYSTGMRLSELVNLQMGQLDAPNGHVKVLGKGNKERIIPLGKELMGDLQNYIANRPAAQPGVGNVFVNKKGKPLYAKYIYNLVHSKLAQVTTIDKKSPHVLRHTFATHLTNNGADLNAVKELLGHSSLAATQVYTHNTIDKLKDIHKKAHPKA